MPWACPLQQTHHGRQHTAAHGETAHATRRKQHQPYSVSGVKECWPMWQPQMSNPHMGSAPPRPTSSRKTDIRCPAWTSVPAPMVQSGSWRPDLFTLYQPVFSSSQLSGNGRTSPRRSPRSSRHDSRTNTAAIEECVAGDKTIKLPLKTGCIQILLLPPK